MRENRQYGSVRGVAGDRYPYRDSACRRAAARHLRAALASTGQAEACPTNRLSENENDEHDSAPGQPTRIIFLFRPA